MKLKPSKFAFFKQEQTYLGHVVSKNGTQTDCRKGRGNLKWPIPTNVTEVCSFLGFTNYYCRFIKKYAQVTKPLYKIISGENTTRKQDLIKCDLECQEAFDKLRKLCITAQILAYADFLKTIQTAYGCKCFRPGSCCISGTGWN